MDYSFKSYPGNNDYYKNVKDEEKLQISKEPVVKSEKVKKQKKLMKVKIKK